MILTSFLKYCCTIFLIFRVYTTVSNSFISLSPFCNSCVPEILFLVSALFILLYFLIFRYFLDRLIVSKMSFSLALSSSFAYLVFCLGRELIRWRIHTLPNSVHGGENEPRKFPKISNPCLQELTNCSKSCLIRTQKDVFGSMNCPK